MSIFWKQVGNGISRRHTKRWKITQGLQSVKYSLPLCPKPPRDRTGAKRGEPLWFFNIHSVANIKNCRGPFGDSEKFSKNSLSVPKKMIGGPLVLSGFVCYAKRKNNLLYFSSFGQMVQFGVWNFVELVKLFWSVRVDWKKSHKDCASMLIRKHVK